MIKKSALLATTLLTAGLGFGTAHAQQNEDVVEVNGRYLSLDQLNSVKTPTPVIDVPQSLSIVTDVQIADQGFANLGDILRYTPGLSISQGEGHRDAINIRGNQSTADFFLNGVRDDVQYYRPLYNLEQVEILRGSNALLFGRGGGGGVINRVTKSPIVGDTFSGVSAGIDTFGAWQLTGDTNLATGDRSALRLNAFVEDMANHRDAFDGTRYGINPTFRTELGTDTTATFFYEHLNDDRVVDRGVPSVNIAGAPNRPLEGHDETFFGSPDANNTTLEAHTFRVRLDHEFGDRLRGNVTVQHADYDKAYQNLYAASFDAVATPNRVTLDGYRDITARTNTVIQANLVGEFNTGAISHTVLAGGEYGDQATDNARFDNLFAASNDDQITIDFSDLLVIPDFAFSTPVRDRSSEVRFTSLYLQDQIDLTDTLKLVVGARFDRFDVEVLDLFAVTATDNGRRGRVDEEVSPRFGLIYKPADNMSFYASYTETFLPSAGDQFLTLSSTTEDIQPQVFENREIGAKWDITDTLSFTAALFRLERGQFTTVDPDDPSIVTTVTGSTTEGFELQLVGEVTDRWTVNAGYSHLDGTVDGGGFDGNATRQTPAHMLSVWNRYQVSNQLGLAIGATYQDANFVHEDNSVEIPAYTRFDAAVYYDLDDATRIQLNVENLFDENYFPDAHSNTNISTGEPLNARLTVRRDF
ncbi:TonB-dependent receptor [Maricaulis maris]|uniref:Catecholate siderophore receptor n=1 Tax=Maricaulis maris TaxID=74318 RepID=A0A495D2K3_9PROT|nr:TonB-dependent siderophore receptor [Maricaulis maris]RKQ95996.1 catecholate siderophore receptor [Maricaulis maris]